MSRSLRAWRQGWTAATVIVRTSGEQTLLGDPQRAELEPQLVARCASRPLRTLVISAMLLAFIPSSALGSRSDLPARPQATRNNHNRTHHSHPTPARAHARRVDPPRCGSLAHAQRANVLLAPGSGYFSPDGSCLVIALQRRLAGAGYAPGPIDGRYGPLTERAVQRLQAARGLAVDGITGPRTLGSLNAATPVIYPGAGFASGGSPPVRVLQRRLEGVSSSV
jgi:hypothetical protein